MYVHIYQASKTWEILLLLLKILYFTLQRVWNIELHNAKNSISGPLDFNIFLRRSYSITPLNKYCWQHEHPSKNLSYGPDTDFKLNELFENDCLQAQFVALITDITFIFIPVALLRESYMYASFHRYSYVLGINLIQCIQRRNNNNYYWMKLRYSTSTVEIRTVFRISTGQDDSNITTRANCLQTDLFIKPLDKRWNRNYSKFLPEGLVSQVTVVAVR